MNKKMNKKMYFAFVLICLIFLLILFRIIQLQIVNKQSYTYKAKMASVKNIQDKARRGSIVARDMTVLAASLKSYELWISSNDVNYNKMSLKEKNDFKEKLEKIKEVIDIDVDSVINSLKANVSSFLLKKHVFQNQLDKISKYGQGFIAAHPNFKRDYTFDFLASNLLGTVNQYNKGISGVEYASNNILSGIDGKKVMTTDRDGEELALQKPKVFKKTDGSTLVITIDPVLQKYVEEALQKGLEKSEAKSASAVLMDTKTGEILALGTSPTFNLNNPKELRGIKTKGLSNEDIVKKYYELWHNPITESIYEPGSVSKLITVAAGIEEGVITPESKYSCGEGFLKVGDVSLNCWVYPNNHGEQTVRKALMNSCNPALIKIGHTIGKKKLYDYMEAFNLPYRSGLELKSESFPFFPAREKVESVEFATMTYGHGYSVTPISMISAVNAIANNGVFVKPHIFKRIIDSKGKLVREIKPTVIRRVLSPSTSKTMLSMMRDIVRGGTAAVYGGFNGIDVGAKTGTTLKLSKGQYTEEVIASYFVVAPVKNPRYSLLVVVDEPKRPATGSMVAGPIARDIIVDVFDYYGSREDDVNEENKVEVPNVVGMKVNDAFETLKRLNFRYSLVNYFKDKKNQYIYEQYPKAGKKVRPGLKVILDIRERNE